MHITLSLYYGQGALALYPGKMQNKLIFSGKDPRGTYNNILKVPENPTVAFWKFQDGRRRIVMVSKSV